MNIEQNTELFATMQFNFISDIFDEYFNEYDSRYRSDPAGAHEWRCNPNQRDNFIASYVDQLMGVY